MLKSYSLLALLFASMSVSTFSFAQIILTENFEGTMNTTSGIPTGWTETGVSTDGIFIVGNSALANAGGYWPVPAHTNFAMTNDDMCDCNKSADRLILPSQNFSTVTGGLTLAAAVYMDGQYGSTGFVEVSTNGGTTWTSVYTMGTSATWQNITVNLTSYAGQSAVLIAFRYNDSGQWATGLAVDDVTLSQVPSFDDLAITRGLGEYTLIPSSQIAPLTVGARVLNNGTATISDAVVTGNVYLAPNFTTPVYSATSSSTAINAGATASITAGVYTPTGPGTYYFEYGVSSATASDINNANDSADYLVTITDSTYARDNGNITQALGIGAGATGIIGQNYQVHQNIILSTVTFAVQGQVPGDTTRVVVYNTSNKVPTTLAGASANYIFTSADTGAIVRTVRINGSAGLSLTPGLYYVGVEEFTATNNLGILGTDSIYTDSTVWAQINNGAWSLLSSFGFPNSFVIRPNFRVDCSNMSATVTSSTPATCGANDGSATVSSTGGSGPYTYAWSSGATTATATNLGAGVYYVTVTDGVGCSDVDTVTISSNSNLAATTASSGTFCFGDSTGMAVVMPTGGTAPFTYNWSNGSINDTLSNVPAGTYMVTVTDALGCVTTSNATVTQPSGIGETHITNDEILGNDGSIDVTFTGGTPPYVYDWDMDGTGDFDDQEDPAGLAGGNYTVVVKDANGCTMSFTITVLSQVGINEIAAGGMSVYPNPNTGNFSVRIPAGAGVGELRLTNITGQQIAVLSVNGTDQMELSFPELAPGVYILKGVGATAVFVETIVIQ